MSEGRAMHGAIAETVLEKCIGPPLHDSFVDILGSPEAADRSQPPA